MNRRNFLTTLATMALGAVGSSAQTTKKAEIGKPFAGPKLKDIVSGNDLDLASFKNRKLVVGIFMQQNCGTTWTYEAKIGNLIKTYQKKGVEFVAIHSASGERDSDLRGMLEQRNLVMPILVDPKANLPMASYIGAVCTPTFFVIDKKGTLAYVGSFDKFGSAPSFVPDALNALLAGKPVPTPRTKAFG